MLLTDSWKSVPFSEALKGPELHIQPAFDNQESIYRELIRDLEITSELFSSIPEGVHLGDDILLDGDREKWQKWCNSLRLRIAIRISDVDMETSSGIFHQVLGDSEKYPIIRSNLDNIQFKWDGNTGMYHEPFNATDPFSEYPYDIAVTSILVDTLMGLGDPRLSVYADPTQSDPSTYKGMFPGTDIKEDSMQIEDISFMGSHFRDDPGGYTYFMRYSEIEFIIAEAAYRGLITGYSAQEAYENGIKASMEEFGIADSLIQDYLLHPSIAWESGNELDKIRFQKWLSLFKQSQEAWAESRRTDIPQMAPAVGALYPDHNRPPFRLPYPTDKLTMSSKITEAPEFDKIMDGFWGVQMWWDTRTGVY
jgi:hypothetical protein